MLAGFTSLADGRSAADDGVGAGVGRAGELEGNRATRVGDDQARRRQGRELRTGRRGVHLGLAEPDEGAVDLGEQQEAAQGATLAQTAVAFGLLGGGHPGGPLRFLEGPPAGGYPAKDAPGGHL